MDIPVELTLQIVKHYHKREDIFFRWVFPGQRCIYCHGFHDFPDKSAHVELRTSDGNVNDALNLRLACRCFARAYDVKYIHRNIGGDFGRKQHADILKRNTQFWWNQLRELAGMEVTNQMLSRYTDDAKSTRSRMYMGVILEHIDDFIENPTLVFDVERVSGFVKKWLVDHIKIIKKVASDIALLSSVYDTFNRMNPERNGIWADRDTWEQSILHKKNYVGFFCKDRFLPAASVTLIPTHADIRSTTTPISTKGSIVRYVETDNIYRLGGNSYFDHSLLPNQMPEGEKVGLIVNPTLTKHFAIAPQLSYSERCRQEMQMLQAKEAFWKEQEISFLKWGEEYEKTISQLQYIDRGEFRYDHPSQTMHPMGVSFARDETAHVQFAVFTFELKEVKEVVAKRTAPTVAELRKRAQLNTKNSRANLMRKTKSTPPPMKNRHKQNYR